MPRGKFSIFATLAAILDFSESLNILKTVRDRPISSILNHMVVLQCPVPRGKTSIFVTFGGHLGFERKIKKCEYLENHKR